MKSRVSRQLSVPNIPCSMGLSRWARGSARTAAEWCDLLARVREALFERVLRADPLAHLETPIEHGMFGPLNWRETLLFMRLHDLDHARQLQKIAATLAASRSA